MSSIARDTSLSIQPFTYTPLDLSQRSIRLLRIHPDLSSSGHVQCEIRDATVDDDYTCVSYVWGKPEDGYAVIMNEQLHQVRRNLFDFLQHARKKSFGWLWIDALCIDQDNLRERTHQVQQMGQIYSQATRVVSWLGTSPDIASLFRQIWAGSKVHYEQAEMQTLFAHKYWTRAWITQEVVLARQHTLMAEEEELPMEVFPRKLGFAVGGFNDLVRLLLLSHDLPNFFKGKSLMYCLDKFCRQECEVPRDRVFSLLALCGEGSDLRVDYKAAVEEVLWRVCNRSSFCFCSLQIASHALLRDNNGPWSMDQTVPSLGLLRTRYAEYCFRESEQTGNYVLLSSCRFYISRLIRTNEAFLGGKQKAPYTTSYFIAMEDICGKHPGRDERKVGGRWVLALCMSLNAAGFDYYCLPTVLNNYRGNDLDSELLHEALKSEIRHCSHSDLQVIDRYVGGGIVRLSLAFWIELAGSLVWRRDSPMGSCKYTTTWWWGGLKLSIT